MIGVLLLVVSVVDRTLTDVDAGAFVFPLNCTGNIRFSGRGPGRDADSVVAVVGVEEFAQGDRT